MSDTETDFENNSESYGDLQETYYKTTIGGMTFQILKLFSEQYAQYTILDARGRDCVHITIQMRRNSKRAYMSQVMYRPSCTMGETMSRGASTIQMVKALLIFVMRDEQYTCVCLKDKSEVDCILPDDENPAFKMSLATLSFMLYGKTWYQRHFGAEIMNVQTLEQMNTANELLESTMIQSDAMQLMKLIRKELSYYNSATWKTDVLKAANEIVVNGSSWRSVFFELFSDKGMLASRVGANLGCMLFETIRRYISNKFNVPDLSSINMRITRQTILSYPESDIQIVLDESPVHIDKKRKEMMIKSSFMFNGASMYMIGGKKTLKASRVRHIWREYGMNLIGYMHRFKISVPSLTLNLFMYPTKFIPYSLHI